MPQDEKDTSTPEPKLIAGKYKTVEEAEAAIREKDALIGRQSQELGSLRKQAQAPHESASRPEADTQAVDQENESLAHALLVNPKGTLARFSQQLLEEADRRATAQVNVALTIDRFLAQKPLARKHYRLFRSILSDLPMNPEDTLESRLDTAYRGLEGELNAAQTEAKKQSDAERRANSKIQAAVVEGDSGAESGKKHKADDDEVDTPDSYLAERAAERDKLQSIV